MSVSKAPKDDATARTETIHTTPWWNKITPEQVLVFVGIAVLMMILYKLNILQIIGKLRVVFWAIFFGAIGLFLLYLGIKYEVEPQSEDTNVKIQNKWALIPIGIVFITGSVVSVYMVFHSEWYANWMGAGEVFSKI